MDISSSSGAESRSSSCNGNCEINTNSETISASASNGVDTKSAQEKIDERNEPDIQFCQFTAMDNASIGGGSNARFSVNSVDNHEGKYNILKFPPEVKTAVWCHIHRSIAKL